MKHYQNVRKLLQKYIDILMSVVPDEFNRLAKIYSNGKKVPEFQAKRDYRRLMHYL